MLLQRVLNAVRSPLEEARLSCLTSVSGRKDTFPLHWGGAGIGATRPSLAKLSVMVCVDLHDICHLCRLARSQCLLQALSLARR